jgi:hypothetical protein
MRPDTVREIDANLAKAKGLRHGVGTKSGASKSVGPEDRIFISAAFAVFGAYAILVGAAAMMF